jgi:hypothetical protein
METRTKKKNFMGWETKGASMDRGFGAAEGKKKIGLKDPGLLLGNK